MKIITDTDIFVSLYKEDDANHEKVIKIASLYEKSNLYISPLTIPEALTVLSYDVSQKKAQEFYKRIKEQKLIVLSLEESIWHKADEIFLAQTKKRTSWFDCLNVALYKYYNMDAIFSFDKFYKRMGLKILK